MRTRSVAGREVSAIGLGCMSLSHAYGAPPPRADAVRLLQRALDLGCNFIDTAALYGFGANEELVGEALSHRRSEFLLASKCGMFRGPDGARQIDGRPQTLKRTCEESLRRLKTDHLDLYYLHRWDKAVPIEDSVGALGELVAEGKVRAIGLSEVSAETLRRAHAVHPIAAVQSEYSLWTRNPEIAVLDACAEIGATFVAFSPLGRGFLAGALSGLEDLPAGDIRRAMPRFNAVNFVKNRTLLFELEALAEALECHAAQLALAWLLDRGSHVAPIPGTTRIDHLEINLRAANLALDAATALALDRVFRPRRIQGHRYNAATQAEIDTEDLAA